MRKPLQPGDAGDLDSSQPVFAHYLVELSAVAPSGQDNIGHEMRAFAEGLKPYPSHLSGALFLTLFRGNKHMPCSIGRLLRGHCLAKPETLPGRQVV